MTMIRGTFQRCYLSPNYSGATAPANSKASAPGAGINDEQLLILFVLPGHTPVRHPPGQRVATGQGHHLMSRRVDDSLLLLSIVAGRATLTRSGPPRRKGWRIKNLLFS
ncbi:hypothetical protein [Thermogemmatispora carboxidivorans]|uniref:hypothetical protein n=1 Tax=Thermogemmatispora carboxidivorans TaxID=1382306 RepID=UPI000699F9A6|nr:hypothetical protein [Thermogemmatispora carboxidivorans]